MPNLLATNGIRGINRSGGQSTLEIVADHATLNGAQIATINDLDSRRFRYLGYERYEKGMIIRDRKLQQRIIYTNAQTGETTEVWEDIPTVEE